MCIIIIAVYFLNHLVNNILCCKPPVRFNELNIVNKRLTSNDVETVDNYKFIIDKVKKKSPQTKVAISALLIRKDKNNYENKIVNLNNAIKNLCEENLIGFIAHDNIDESCLGFKNKLHLNKKGNAYFANNFIKYVQSTS